MHNPVSKTPINYYGGKISLLAHIMPLIPEHEVYTEIFFGGGTVFFAKNKVKNETINDKSELVVNFYEQLKLNSARRTCTRKKIDLRRESSWSYIQPRQVY